MDTFSIDSYLPFKNYFGHHDMSGYFGHHDIESYSDGIATREVALEPKAPFC